MPRKKKTHQTDPNGVHDFRHADARRPNNPPAGVPPTYEVCERQTRQYAYDPHPDPQLLWAGKGGWSAQDVRS
jgi:adenine-specific DNA-methyltransferase